MFSDEEMMRHFKDGEVILEEGDPGKEMYIIAKGKVVISKKSEEVITNLATLKEGDIFGEMALVESRPRSATAKAAGDVAVRVLDRDSFRSLIADNPKIAMLVFDKMCQRLRAVNDELQQAMVQDSKMHKALGHIAVRRGML